MNLVLVIRVGCQDFLLPHAYEEKYELTVNSELYAHVCSSTSRPSYGQTTYPKWQQWCMFNCSKWYHDLLLPFKFIVSAKLSPRTEFDMQYLYMLHVRGMYAFYKIYNFLANNDDIPRQAFGDNANSQTAEPRCSDSPEILCQVGRLNT